MKVAIVTDSNSGITQEEAKNTGIHVLPMPFMMDGQTYFEDISLTQDKFYEKLKEGADISTSQPSPGDILDLWNRLLEEYDQVVTQAITALDEGEQEELYKRALTILSEQAASVWLQDLCDLTVMSPKLTGLELYRTYVLDMSTIRYAE